jgi:putative addiction module component (TIGR02574 family)
MKTLDSIAADALLLPADQRLSLAHKMLSSVDGNPDPNTESAWQEEIQERIRKYDSGETQGIPGPEAMRDLKRKLAP